MQKLSRYFQNFAGFLLILILFTSISTPPAAAAQEGEQFLTTLASQTTYDLKPQQNRLGAARVQPVTFKADVFDQVKKDVAVSPQKLTLQIFSDLELEITFDQQSSSLTGTNLLSGFVTGDPQGWIHLAETDGLVSADLVYHNIQYQLRQNDGLYVFTEIDQSQFPREADPIVPEISFADQTPQALDVTYDSGAYVDVLVVYTATARSYEGGTAAMQSLINLAVLETNAGYADSGVNHRMRLMHTEEVDYSEVGFNWSTAINRLEGSSDGYIDNVHTLRNTYGADLVVMIVGDGEYCGIGYLLPVNSSAYDQAGFSVVSRLCATSYYSFGHETGHNMGAHHDRANASSTGLFPYSYGYQYLDPNPYQSFRTIMAYNCPSGCIRINHWSNPDVNYNNQPTGVLYTAPDSADNRRTLNNSAYAVANFRQSVDLQAPSNLTAPSIAPYSIGLSFADNSDDETGFRIERSPNNTTWSNLVTLPSNTTTYTDINNIQCNTTYYYRVSALIDSITSNPSNTLPVTSGTCIVPDAPANARAIPSLTRVTLLWLDTLGETNYKIQQSPNGSTGWVDLQTLPANTTQANVINLLKNTTYYFRIGVVNSSIGTTYNFTPVLTVTTHSQAAYLPLTVR